MDRISAINDILKEVVDKDIYYSKRISFTYNINPIANAKAYYFNRNNETDTLKCFILFGSYSGHEVLYNDSEDLVASALDRAINKDKSGFVFRCICMEYFLFIGHYLATDFSITEFVVETNGLLTRTGLYNHEEFAIEANRLIKILEYIKNRYIKHCGRDLSTICFTNEINQLKEWYKKD